MGPAAAALAALIDDPMFAKSVAAAAITPAPQSQTTSRTSDQLSTTSRIPDLRHRRQGFRSYNNLETGCRTFLKRASANPIVSAHMLRKSCWSRNEPARAVTGAAALGGLQDQRRPGIG
ncbi:Uncharacterised protein [Mycobacterium tuberculosis]|nr:Uncharacterised protein [Mycobacterium tuberculosis]